MKRPIETNKTQKTAGLGFSKNLVFLIPGLDGCVDLHLVKESISRENGNRRDYVS